MLDTSQGHFWLMSRLLFEIVVCDPTGKHCLCTHIQSYITVTSRSCIRVVLSVVRFPFNSPRGVVLLLYLGITLLAWGPWLAAIKGSLGMQGMCVCTCSVWKLYTLLFWEHVLQGQLRYTKNARYVPTRCEGHVKQAFISSSLATTWLKVKHCSFGLRCSHSYVFPPTTLEDKSWCYSRRVCPSRYYTKP